MLGLLSEDEDESEDFFEEALGRATVDENIQFGGICLDHGLTLDADRFFSKAKELGGTEAIVELEPLRCSGL